MGDVVFVGMALVFFATGFGLIAVCQWLMED